MSDVLVQGIDLTTLQNRVTTLDGVGAQVPSRSTIPVMQSDLNGLHTTLNQLTLTLQAQLNTIATQVAVAQAALNALLAGPIIAPLTIAAIPGQALTGYNQTTGAFTQSGNLLQTVQITLTSAQILSLGTIPVQILPAPGAGQMIVPVLATAKLIYNSIAYIVAVDSLLLVVGAAVGTGNAAGPFALIGGPLAGFLDQIQSAYQIIGGMADASTLTQIINQPLNITTKNGTNPTSGNSTVILTVQYYIQTA